MIYPPEIQEFLQKYAHLLLDSISKLKSLSAGCLTHLFERSIKPSTNQQLDYLSEEKTLCQLVAIAINNTPPTKSVRTSD